MNTAEAIPLGDALHELLIQRKKVESLLAMLKGNTRPDDIAKLEEAWLHPILNRMAELKSTTPVNVHEYQAISRRIPPCESDIRTSI